VKSGNEKQWIGLAGPSCHRRKVSGSELPEIATVNADSNIDNIHSTRRTKRMTAILSFTFCAMVAG
jgi:hypothetical protein